jgi:hypothetical protein
MSATPRDGQQQQRPRASSDAGSDITGPRNAPTPHSLDKQSSSSVHYVHRTPPSPSAAPSATNVGAALWAFRNAATPSVVGSEAHGPTSTSALSRKEGVAPATTSALASTATTTTSEDILRRVYNEKLHASVRSIIATLSTELPEDHIFLQLLADPSTQQYCKVRLAEVVEGFLYSTQAEQYHELATELARREQEGEAQRQRIDELEAALAHAINEAHQLQQQLQHRAVDVEVSSHVSRHPPPSPSSHFLPLEAAAAASSSSAAAPRLPLNPMEDEEARQELLRVLEQSTHDHELLRCQQALQAVTRVVGVMSSNSMAAANYLYEAELQGELFRCVQSLLQYVDGALESQERLRREVLEQHPRILEESRDATAAVTTTNGRGSDGSSAAGGGGGALVSSDYSTPKRPRVSLGTSAGHEGGSVLSSAINSHLSSSSAPQRLPLPPLPHDQTTTAATLHGVGAIQQRREELQRLAKELCGGQLRSQHMWDQLEQAQEQHRRQVAQLKREVEEARSEAAAAATAVHNAQRAKEQAELHDKLADALAQLAATKVDLQASRQAVESSKSRISEVETTVAELTDELTSAKAALQQKEALLLAQQKERSVCQGELTMLKAAHQEDTGALQDAARELLCLRVEKTMAGLSAVYQEAKAAKADLLEREGYRHLCNTYSAAVAIQKEAVRHAQAQLHVSETAQLEKAMTQRSAADALGVLLRRLWADDATDAALQESTTADSDDDGVNNINNMENRRTSHAAGKSAAVSIESTGRADGEAVHHISSHPPTYRLPTTLAGLCSALDCAYANVRTRHLARQKTIDSLRITLVGKDIELHAAQATEVQLRDQLRAEQAKEEQWKADLAQLSDNNPMRDLLARQDALLKAVSEERNALRRQWNSLSGDYIALEQRNGILHARCAEKEHENARLSGILLRSSTAAPLPTPRPSFASPAVAGVGSTSTTQCLPAGETAGPTPSPVEDHDSAGSSSL